MDDPFVVRGGEAVGDLHGVVERLAHRQASFAQSVAKRGAFEQLGDDERRAVVRSKVEDDQQVGMIERAGGARLLLEARQVVAVLRHRRGEDLERHLAPDARVARAIDLAHAAGAERAGDLVGSEAGADCERHQPILTASIDTDPPSIPSAGNVTGSPARDAPRT